MTTDKVTKLGNIIGANSSDITLNKIKDLFGLSQCEDKLIVQKPNDVSVLTQSDLSSYNPEAKYLVMRIQIDLTDWEIGHFSSYDDHQHTNWKTGDVTIYDWQSTSVCSANASNNNRVMYQLTGVVTEKTNEFINRLKRFGSHQLELTDNSWF